MIGVSTCNVNLSPPQEGHLGLGYLGLFHRNHLTSFAC
jgi:hypothetical protein